MSFEIHHTTQFVGGFTSQSLNVIIRSKKIRVLDHFHQGRVTTQTYKYNTMKLITSYLQIQPPKHFILH